MIKQADAESGSLTCEEGSQIEIYEPYLVLEEEMIAHLVVLK